MELLIDQEERGGQEHIEAVGEDAVEVVEEDPRAPKDVEEPFYRAGHSGLMVVLFDEESI